MSISDHDLLCGGDWRRTFASDVGRLADGEIQGFANTGNAPIVYMPARFSPARDGAD